MSIALLELAAAGLGPVLDEVAFLGGASMVLWANDPGAPDQRTTMDVDVIVVVEGRGDYYRLGERLRQQGFREDDESGVICRWRHDSGLILDVMPTDEAILGFRNQWYEAALAAAEAVTLPSGTTIQAVTPAYLFATKLDAFRDRGGGDYLASVDFEDIVRLVDGRARLIEEVEASPADLQRFIADELGRLLQDRNFEAGVAGGLLPDAASQERRQVVLERIRRMSHST